MSYLVNMGECSVSAHECLHEAFAAARALACRCADVRVLNDEGLVLGVVGRGYAVMAALHRAQRENTRLLKERSA